MAMHLYVRCACGRNLRARPEQAGAKLHCWHCGRDRMVPYPRLRGRLALGSLVELRDALRAENLVLAVAGAILLTAALALPVIGPWLAAALLVAAAGWAYGELLQDEGEGERYLTAPDEGLESDDEPDATEPDARPDLPVWGPPVALRLALGTAAAAALVAPACLRLGDRALPWFAGWGGSRWGMLLSLAAWVVVPCLMLAGYARGPDDRPYPSRVAAALVRLPVATLAALILPLVGLVLIESLAALVAFQQGQLRLLVNDVFPPPRISVGLDRAQCTYRYDDLQFTFPFPYEPTDALPLYRRALGRGYTLAAAVPASMPDRLASRFQPDLFSGTSLGYFVFRFSLTVMIASVLLFLLGVQARWLGLIGAAAVMVPPWGVRAELEDEATATSRPSSSGPARGPASVREGKPSPPSSASPAASPGSPQPSPMSLSSWGPSPIPPASSPSSAAPAPAPAASPGSPQPSPMSLSAWGPSPIPPASSPSSAAPAPAPAASPRSPQPSPMSLSSWGPSPIPPASSRSARPPSATVAGPAAATSPPPNEGKAVPIASDLAGGARADTTPAPSSAGTSESAPAAAHEAPRILVTDEEAHVAEGLARALAGRGFAPAVALDGMEVLREARRDPPGLILLDLRLPNGNGLVVCQVLRADPATRSIPILIAASRAGEPDELAALAAGADDFVRKPCHIDVLTARIGKLVRRAAPR